MLRGRPEKGIVFVSIIFLSFNCVALLKSRFLVPVLVEVYVCDLAPDFSIDIASHHSQHCRADYNNSLLLLVASSSAKERD
mmetsp:Transcript_28156/g.82973  ORF Transcript_28156/g.82973 Transcript_28156/m.82973 type:complete len:81 (+) Transcript_28156:2204-2446(+)